MPAGKSLLVVVPVVPLKMSWSPGMMAMLFQLPLLLQLGVPPRAVPDRQGADRQGDIGAAVDAEDITGVGQFVAHRQAVEAGALNRAAVADEVEEISLAVGVEGRDAVGRCRG